jgi:acetate kinase
MTDTNQTGTGFVLTLNVGSSSLKFAVFAFGAQREEVFRGEVEGRDDRKRWLDQVIQKTSALIHGQTWAGIGHRIVHGGPQFSAPALVDAGFIEELKRLIPFAPEHLPAEIELIEEVTRWFPHVPQVVCFDTAFHRDLPRVARVLPLPRRYESVGVRRYGFHGLSYEFLRGELDRLGDAAVKRGRVILAHLGNGASLAALRDGACIDTSMAFTPAAGLVMGTRTGDLDPGLVAYLAQTEGLTPERLARLVNHESGLLGVSETTADMRQLLGREKTDERAAEAVALFCYQAKKWIGAYAAALGGLDTLVFAGGIGEHNAAIRVRICAGLDFLGLQLDESRNATASPVISMPASRVIVRVIRTNEEQVIAGGVVRLLNHGGSAAQNI